MNRNEQIGCWLGTAVTILQDVVVHCGCSGVFGGTAFWWVEDLACINVATHHSPNVRTVHRAGSCKCPNSGG